MITKLGCADWLLRQRDGFAGGHSPAGDASKPGCRKRRGVFRFRLQLAAVISIPYDMTAAKELERTVETHDEITAETICTMKAVPFDRLNQQRRGKSLFRNILTVASNAVIDFNRFL